MTSRRYSFSVWCHAACVGCFAAAALLMTLSAAGSLAADEPKVPPLPEDTLSAELSIDEIPAEQ